MAARAGQGVFAALLAPAALSILGYSFTDPAMRGKAFGLFGAVAGAGGAIGLILGGSLTQFISWRWCMYVNVPLALVTIIGAVTQIPKMERDTETRIDWVGVVLSVLGAVSLVYGFSLVEVGGWTDPQALAYMIGGLVVLAIFAFTQRIIKNPLLPLSILKDRTRSGANITVAIISAGMFSMFLFLLSIFLLPHGPNKYLAGAGPVIRH